MRRSIVAEVTLALTWLSVALGLISKSVETASNLPRFLIPSSYPCHSWGADLSHRLEMSAGLSWFAEYQPFTPVTEKPSADCRVGRAIGNSAAIAVCWCVRIALVSHLWAKRLFNRRLAG